MSQSSPAIATATPLPPYVASLITSEDFPTHRVTLDVLEDGSTSFVAPYGGTLILPACQVQRDDRFAKGLQRHLAARDGWRIVRRLGPLPGAANWTHEHADAGNTRVSKDTLVKAPLGVLWFGGPADGILPTATDRSPR
ncbi:MAG: hypothetical protein U0793_31365 [Gemmataceae bacterium]